MIHRKPAYEELEKQIDKLQHNERYYRLIMDNAADMISKHDPDGRFIYVSPASYCLTGYTPEELEGRNAYDFFHPDDYEKIRAIHGEILKAPVTYTVPYRFSHKLGHYVWLEAISKAIRNPDTGDVSEIIATTRDIASRIQVENALAERLEFEHLVSTVSSELLSINSDQMDVTIENALASIGKVAGADRAYVFLYREDSEIADNTHEWCAENIVPQKNNLRGIILKKELPWFAERISAKEVFVVPDINMLPPEAQAESEHFQMQDILSLMVVPMAFGKRLLGFIGFDAVTEKRVWTHDHQTYLRFFGEIFSNAIVRNRAEIKLRESEERFRVLFEQADDAMFVHDLQGRFRTLNSMACRRLGYTEDELLNMTVADVDPDFMEREDDKKFWPSLPVRLESRHKRKDGSVFAVEVRLSKIVFRDQNLVLSIVSDITRRKHLEEEREQLIKELKEALSNVRTLSGLIPICASCKKIRDDQGYWNQIETYIKEHSEVEFSHSLCPDCVKKLYPDFKQKNS